MKDQRWVLKFAIILMAITTIPYFVGCATETLSKNQNERWVFTGFVFGVEDGNSYIAKSLRGMVGDWLFVTPYTANPQKGIIAFIPYILLGKLASNSGAHDQLIALFHLLRIGSGVLMILVTYRFIAFYVDDLGLRRYGLFLVTIGGGIGWTQVLFNRDTWLGSLPLEFYSPETFGFLSLYGIPHLVLARAFMLWGLLIFLKAITSDKVPLLRTSIKICLLWFGVVLSQPVTAGLMGGLIGIFILEFGIYIIINSRHDKGLWSKWRGSIQLLFISGILPGLFMLYYLISFLNDPFLKAWNSQNIISSPHPLHYFLAFGLLVPFAWFGIKLLYHKKRVVSLLPITWVLVFPILAYLPINIQRRLPEGVWVAIVILALNGVVELQKKFGKIINRRSFVYLTTITFPGSIMLLLGGVLVAMNLDYPVLRPIDEINAFQFLAEQCKSTDAVLTSYNTGNALPAWAPVHVLIGHGPESIGLTKMRSSVEAFYHEETTDLARLELLRKYHIRYVFFGPAERLLGDTNLFNLSYLKSVFQSGDYIVFENVLNN